MLAQAVSKGTRRSKEKDAVELQKGIASEKNAGRTLWKEGERCEEDAKTQKQ